MNVCGGGCAARAHLCHKHSQGEDTLMIPDPYCPLDQHIGPLSGTTLSDANMTLVHTDYLCTWIGRPKEHK